LCLRASGEEQQRHSQHSEGDLPCKCPKTHASSWYLDQLDFLFAASKAQSSIDGVSYVAAVNLFPISHNESLL
jgi:hypothetical protein